MTVDLSQYVNQTVDVVYRNGKVRRNVVIHYDGPKPAAYPYIVKGNTYTEDGSLRLLVESDLDIVKITSIKTQMSQKLYSAKLVYDVFVIASNPQEVKEIIDSNVGEIVDEGNSKVEFISSFSTLDSLIKNHPLQNYLHPYTTDGLANLSAYEWMKLKEALNNLTSEEKDKIISKLSPEQISSLLNE